RVRPGVVTVPRPAPPAGFGQDFSGAPVRSARFGARKALRRDPTFDDRTHAISFEPVRHIYRRLAWAFRRRDSRRPAPDDECLAETPRKGLPVVSRVMPGEFLELRAQATGARGVTAPECDG